MRKTLILCALAALTGMASAAPKDEGNPWVGTWVLDVARSQLAGGDTFTLTPGPGSLIHYADAGQAYDFAVDSRPYPARYGRTIAWTPAGPRTWIRVARREGRVLSEVREVLSADGRTLTIQGTGTQPDGSPNREEDVYVRVAGTAGLIGTWRHVKVENPAHVGVLVIAWPSADTLRYEWPQSLAVVEGPCDGSDLAVRSPVTPQGATFAFTRVDTAHLTGVVKMNGQVVGYMDQTLAADGRSLKYVAWEKGRKEHALTLVYVRP